MGFKFSVLTSLLLVVSASAATVRRQPRARAVNPIVATYTPSNQTGPSLENVPGRYVTTIQLNSRDFRVAIDTGSSDLWVQAPPDFSFDQSTNFDVELDFGVATRVLGKSGFVAAELGGYTVPQQAFTNVSRVDLTLILDIGLNGLIGFAFAGSANSPITNVFAGKGLDPTLAQPFLFNVFDQTPNQDNFIGISLSRTDDLEGSADASFTINELDPTYADAIEQTTAVPLFPETPNGRWSLLVDAVYVGQTSLPLSSQTSPVAPLGKMVALMDTGTPTATLPNATFFALYSSIPGSMYSVTDGTFIIPCNTTTIAIVVIGGVQYPIHPLDLSDVGLDDTGSHTVCTSSIGPAFSSTAFDALFGDTIMRNIYSVLNFGDVIAKSATGDSSMNLLSVTNAQSAVEDVQNIRMAQMPSNPPEYTSPPAGYEWTYPPTGGAAASAHIDAALDTASSSNQSDNDGTVAKYAPIVIGLLGGNLLVVLILLGLGIALYVKRSGRATRDGAGRYQRVQFSRKGDESEPLDGLQGGIGRYSD